MKTLITVSIALSAFALPAHGASAQSVSEDDVRCFTTGICKVEAEKKFSLANISTSAPRQTAAAAASAPQAPGRASAPVYRPKPVRVANNNTRPPRQLESATRQSLDMRLSFELNSAQLTADAMANADIFAKVLKESANSAGTFLIEGHTDSIGSRASNLDLSRRRAQTVVAYLADHGVPSSKLRAVGYGFDHPRDGLPASDPGNRRVEIVKN